MKYCHFFDSNVYAEKHMYVSVVNVVIVAVIQQQVNLAADNTSSVVILKC